MEEKITENQVMDYCLHLLDGCKRLNLNYYKFDFYKRLNDFYNKRLVNGNYMVNVSNKECVNFLEDISKEINYYYESRSPKYRKYKLQNIIKRNEVRKN